MEQQTVTLLRHDLFCFIFLNVHFKIWSQKWNQNKVIYSSTYLLAIKTFGDCVISNSFNQYFVNENDKKIFNRWIMLQFPKQILRA